MSTAIAWSANMDGYGEAFLGHNYYSFNLLQPSYHDEEAFKFDCSFDDGFGFDPSPAEHSMLNKQSKKTGLLGAKPSLLPYQLSASCLLRQGGDEMLALDRNYSSRVVTSIISGPGYTSAQASYEEKVQTETATPTSCSMAKRRRGKDQAMEASRPVNLSNNSAKKGRSCQSSPILQSSRGAPGVEGRKQLSLEKNRIAASKCRTKKKVKNDQMLQDSRAKAKENKELRDLVRTMENELHTLTVSLSAHSNSSTCKNPEEMKGALRMLHAAEMSQKFPDLSDGSPMVDSPALSFSPKSSSNESSGRSPATPNTSTAYMSTWNSCLLFDAKVDSPLYAEDSED